MEQEARYTNAEKTQVRFPEGSIGEASDDNPAFVLLRDGREAGLSILPGETTLTEVTPAIAPTPIADFEPLSPSKDDVRNEARRRLILLAGARDRDHLDVLLSNAALDVGELLDIGEANWSVEQAARAAQFRTLKAGVNEIRKYSNVLEAMAKIPTDFAADIHWPGVGP